MKRGDLVAIALPGAYGKPRPALVIQSDFFDLHPSVTVIPVTGEHRSAPLFRVDVRASPSTGLRKRSQLMVDKIHTVPRAKVRQTIGHIDDDTMIVVERALAVFLGFA